MFGQYSVVAGLDARRVSQVQPHAVAQRRVVGAGQVAQRLYRGRRRPWRALPGRSAGSMAC